MHDALEKYISMPDTFANKAGELHRMLEVQKRYMDKVMNGRPDEDTKGLILAVAETYQVGMDLLGYMKSLVQGVANDAVALSEGSEVRNINKMQSDEIRRLWDLMELHGLK